MKVAIFGCLHGQLDDMFEAVKRHETEHNHEVDLIIVCGDCQTIRHADDLRCLAVPQKFKRLGDFHEYYSGKKKVPRLTIFVGGNHEASNYLLTMPYGGWVCDDFYYLGFASVINFRGLRIGGVSGIYNYHNCNKGRYERLPLDDQSMRSIYHTRRLDIFRLQLLSKNIDRKDKMLDVFMSHDWPARIYDHGNLAQLLRFKPFFKEDIARREGLGNPMTQPLVQQLKPRRWFAAHLHCRFEAKVVHNSPKGHCTDFLSLNKIEGKRQFEEYLDLEPINATTEITQSVKNENDDDSAICSQVPAGTNQEDQDNELYYDPEWLTILRKTRDLEYSSNNNVPCPNIKDDSAQNYFPSEEEIEETIELMNKTGGLQVKRNFCMSEPVIYNCPDGQPSSIDKSRETYYPNPQHIELCSRLGISDSIAEVSNESRNETTNPSQVNNSSHNSGARHGRNSNQSNRRGQTNPAYPHRDYEHQRMRDGDRQSQQSNRPIKKVAVELDEDGCLPFSVDKSGNVS